MLPRKLFLPDFSLTDKRFKQLLRGFLCLMPIIWLQRKALTICLAKSRPVFWPGSVYTGLVWSTQMKAKLKRNIITPKQEDLFQDPDWQCNRDTTFILLQVYFSLNLLGWVPLCTYIVNFHLMYFTVPDICSCYATSCQSCFLSHYKVSTNVFFVG